MASALWADAYRSATSTITSNTCEVASAAAARSRLSAALICPGRLSSRTNSAASPASIVVPSPVSGKRTTTLSTGLGSNRACLDPARAA
jgi:hypothetical protein